MFFISLFYFIITLFLYSLFLKKSTTFYNSNKHLFTIFTALDVADAGHGCPHHPRWCDAACHAKWNDYCGGHCGGDHGQTCYCNDC